ncbi:phosphotransferase [Sanguibacter suaedae]|uniref:Phosphotransferase n=1 Tax=Sanguibacter suaedae TaxID=2795737 RepID=A0A934MBY7_9MICO|nr:phosphotransferase [Sanguibacter suaedae]MBI9115826.1 phosphotransferase [Sanguibacter suaedae]
MTGTTWTDLARWAAARLGLPDDEPVSLGGATGQVFAHGRHVLRTGWSAVLDTELLAAGAASSVVPVPTVLDRVDDPGTGRSVVLQPLLPGSTAYVDESVGERRARRRGEACGHVHRALADLAAPAGLPVAAGLGPGTAPSGMAQSEAALPAPPGLLHLDLHPLNLLLGDDDEVVAVLDWTNTAAGPADLDRARTATVLHLDPEARLIADAPVWRAFVDGWTRVAGLDDVPPVALAWACRYMADDLAARYPAQAIAHLVTAHDRAADGVVALRR